MNNISSRILLYPEAIQEAISQEMEHDPKVIIFGLDVDDPKSILGTTKNLLNKYGADRVFGTPLSEEAMTGAAVGMALAGLKPIHVHMRMDFLMLAMNQIINVAAKTHYMSGGQEYVPMVIRSIIGKSWGQGAQHSQALYSFFMHVPGLKVVAPSTPYDAKGCMIAAIRDNNPIMYVEHRHLYYQKGFVKSDLYSVKPGKARVITEGNNITIVGISNMVVESIKAQKYLQDIGISAEVIDPIWLSPLDLDTIETSVKKTKNLLVVDNGWTMCGAGSEIIASITERLQTLNHLKVKRIGFAPTPCPTTPSLEKFFYPNALSIASSANDLLNKVDKGWVPKEREDLKDIEFKGPF